MTVTLETVPAYQSAGQQRLLKLCQMQLIATLLLSRLAVPMGDKQIQVTWIVGVACFLFIARETGWAVSGFRLAAITCLALVTVFESLYCHYAFSPFSLTYLFGIYGPLCLTLPGMNEDDVRQIWKTFINISIALALCGLLQVVVQALWKGYFLDPISLLPANFQLSGYMTFYKTSLGPMQFVKPNGMFALEPSFFSQFVALGLIAELHYFQRLKVFAVLLAALLASLAGTGLLILIFGLPFIKRSPRWIIFLLAAGLVWTAFMGNKAIDFYSQRMGELATPGSSGNARFIAPYQLMWQHWNNSKKELLVGIGAGESSTQTSFDEANLAPVTKVGIEFGLIGLLGFVFYWMGMYFNLAAPACIRAALFAFYFVASGALLHPPTVFPLWTLTLGFLPATRAVGALTKGEEI